jgi:hypothetical protein
LLFYRSGLRVDLFDSRGYRDTGRELVEDGQLSRPTYVFYIIPISLVGLFEKADSSLTAFFIFQSVISLLAALALYKSAAHAYSNRSAGLCAALIFALWWDNIQWNTALMTESLACSLTCFLIHRLVFFKDQQLDLLAVALLCVACLLTRPTGVINVVAVTIFFVHRYRQQLRARPIIKYGVLITTFLLLAGGAWLMFAIWDFTDQYVRGNIVTYMDSIEGQPLYYESLRLATDEVAKPESTSNGMLRIAEFIYRNPLHFLQAASLKIFYLLSGVRPYYSWLHNSLTLMFLFVIYYWSFIGNRLLKRRDVALLCLSTIVVNCLLVGVSTIDWDNRFYIPMEPAIVLLAAGGAARFWSIVKDKLRLSA